MQDVIELVVIPSSLDDDGSLVVSEGNVVGSWEGGQGPNALVPVVKRTLLRVNRSGHLSDSFCEVAFYSCRYCLDCEHFHLFLLLYEKFHHCVFLFGALNRL